MQSTLSDFLATAKAGLRDAIDNKQKVTLVVGDENAGMC